MELMLDPYTINVEQIIEKDDKTAKIHTIDGNKYELWFSIKPSFKQKEFSLIIGACEYIDRSDEIYDETIDNMIDQIKVDLKCSN